MRAIRVHEAGGPEVLKLEQAPDPKPDAGQVVVKVEAVGVNPVETYIRAGKYPITKPFPYTPGNDAAGTVVAVGSGVTAVKTGDRVYTAGTLSGAYAEMVLCKQETVHPLPPKVTFEQGAALGVPYGTAWYGVHLRGKVQPGETLLIHGASGGVGIAATQIAVAWGVTVIGTAGSEKGLELVRQQGAQHVLNHHQAEYLKQVMDLAGGQGVNMIIECLANENLNKDLGVLAPFGRVVVIGSRGPVEIDPRQTMQADRSILGMSLNNADAHALKSIHAGIGAGLRNGSFSPVIGKRFPLAEAAQSHEAVMKGGAYGKIVLTC